MKTLDIAFKDLTRSFRSYFALVFMFGVPLLVTGMFYLMFGSIFNKESESAGLSPTKVVIANLDRGGGAFSQGLAISQPGLEASSVGELVVKMLQNEQLADLMIVSFTSDAASARAAVDTQQAGVAIIIPEDFSENFSGMNTTAEIEFYQDPTLSLGPAIVRSILFQFLEGISGTKIAVKVALSQDATVEAAQLGQVIQRYLAAWLPAQQDPDALLLVQSPQEDPVQGNPVMGYVGPIMGGMLIFFAFFSGASTAQSILTEDELGTLRRLFTTPTSAVTILSGKFLSVALTVIVQVCVLLIVANLVFGIHWGTIFPVALAAIGIITTATAFGICLMSLLKNARQAGSVMGGALTVTGMLGMMPIFVRGSANPPPFLNIVSLLVPQGWANRILIQAMEGTVYTEVLLTFAVLIAISFVLFSIGVLRFQRRYA
jgi:ABC-2 type transport system permease protein